MVDEEKIITKTEKKIITDEEDDQVCKDALKYYKNLKLKQPEAAEAFCIFQTLSKAVIDCKLLNPFEFSVEIRNVSDYMVQKVTSILELIFLSIVLFFFTHIIDRLLLKGASLQDFQGLHRTFRGF